MQSATRKLKALWMRVLTYLVRNNSLLARPFLGVLSLGYKDFSRLTIGAFEPLSQNDQNVIFEAFPSCRVAVYPPKQGKCVSDCSDLGVECPAVRAFLFREQGIHVNSSCAFDTHTNVIRGDFIIKSKGYKYEASFLKAHGLKAGLIDRGEVVEDIPKGIFFGGNGSFNYYHFLIEIIPKLDALMQLKGYEDFALLVNEKVDQIDTFSEIIKLYAPDHELLLLKEDQCYQVEQLVCISSGSYLPFNLSAGKKFKAADFITRPESVAFLRRMALPAIDTIEMETPPRMFLARKQMRRGYNQEEVYASLEPLGFVCIYPEDFSFLEQVKLFSSAECIVGPTGAAWTNLTFASGNSKALCWMAEEYGDFAAFSTLAGLVGVDLQYHTYSSDVNSTASLYSQHYQLDPFLILESVRRMLND